MSFCNYLFLIFILFNASFSLSSATTKSETMKKDVRFSEAFGLVYFSERTPTNLQKLPTSEVTTRHDNLTTFVFPASSTGVEDTKNCFWVPSQSSERPQTQQRVSPRPEVVEVGSSQSLNSKAEEEHKSCCNCLSKFFK
ncbi:hypothetical protein HYV11_01055 [Candidatus Dependentiae bacterium]|nr:hypothetical protein [Candidatus Dependentiae bacterium]